MLDYDIYNVVFGSRVIFIFTARLYFFLTDTGFERDLPFIISLVFFSGGGSKGTSLSLSRLFFFSGGGSKGTSLSLSQKKTKFENDD